ncbi:hypothetical protein Psal006b_01564 [Piscirickettsia salmonis]|nr:hypothetical protein Psal006b_01564 [Piscirickettsia salmonis]
MECAASRHVTLCDADSRGFIVVAFCSAILHHWMCKIPTEVATLTIFYSYIFVFLYWFVFRLACGPFKKLLRSVH